MLSISGTQDGIELNYHTQIPLTSGNIGLNICRIVTVTANKIYYLTGQTASNSTVSNVILEGIRVG